MTTKTIFWLNTHLFNKTIMEIVHREILYLDSDRYTQICQYIRQTSPTMVVLSEVWSYFVRKQFTEDLKDLYPYSWRPRFTNLIRLGPEFVILSKKPMTDTCWENFKDLSGWDGWSEKKVCGFTIGNTLYCCTHLDTSTDCIYSNLDQVKTFIQKEGNGKNVILMGDFNLSEFVNDGDPASGLGSEYTHMTNVLSSIGLQDTQRMVYPNYALVPLYTVDGNNNTFLQHQNPGYTTLRRLDYFMSRGIVPTATSVVVGNYSDHFGITLTYQ